MQSIFEQMGGTYRSEGDYLVPNIALDTDTGRPIGRYGWMRKQYLEEHRPVVYNQLLLSGKLWEHLEEIDTICNEQIERMILAMAKREGVTEALKASDQMEWVGRMNNFRSRAEEIVLHELVYT